MKKDKTPDPFLQSPPLNLMTIRRARARGEALTADSCGFEPRLSNIRIWLTLLKKPGPLPEPQFLHPIKRR